MTYKLLETRGRKRVLEIPNCCGIPAIDFRINKGIFKSWIWSRLNLHFLIRSRFIIFLKWHLTLNLLEFPITHHETWSKKFILQNESFTEVFQNIIGLCFYKNRSTVHLINYFLKLRIFTEIRLHINLNAVLHKYWQIDNSIM